MTPITQSSRAFTLFDMFNHPSSQACEIPFLLPVSVPYLNHQPASSTLKQSANQNVKNLQTNLKETLNMKTLIASTVLALTLIAGVSGPASAADDFSTDSFFQQMSDNAR